MSLTKELAALKYTNHLMLPLVGIHWFSVQHWLKETWLEEDGKHLIMETAVHIPLIRNGEYGRQGRRHYYRFRIPEEFLPDVQRFIEGKYSQFSDRARRLITDLSGLPYNVPDPKKPTFIQHHVLLVAIDSREEMEPWRTAILEELSLEIYGDPYSLQDAPELLSPPATREQVFYKGEWPL